jgi:hypothetical protein
LDAPAQLGYENIFRVLIMQFIDAHSFDVRSVKKTCVHIVHPDGRLIPFDTYNLFYRDGLEQSRLTLLRQRAELAMQRGHVVRRALIVVLIALLIASVWGFDDASLALKAEALQATDAHQSEIASQKFPRQRAKAQALCAITVILHSCFVCNKAHGLEGTILAVTP